MCNLSLCSYPAQTFILLLSPRERWVLWIAQTTKRDFKTTSLRSGEMLPHEVVPEETHNKYIYICISFDPIFLVWEIKIQPKNFFWLSLSFFKNKFKKKYFLMNIPMWSVAQLLMHIVMIWFFAFHKTLHFLYGFIHGSIGCHL